VLLPLKWHCFCWQHKHVAHDIELVFVYGSKRLTCLFYFVIRLFYNCLVCVKMWLYVYFLSLKERILCFELFLTHYSCPYMWYSGRPLDPSATMFHEPLIENSVASWVSYICTHLEPILWCKTSSYQFSFACSCRLVVGDIQNAAKQRQSAWFWIGSSIQRYDFLAEP